ncbi:TetR/AcrR family transcriptional regulator [Gordonia soli]|uniref:Putative TetR family transcriptional regulator n=1 Tax=Gordonia soli NBRC 108243 TaxID=1223545 RepID=M0QDT8_9ACTN|nr:TetR/AcrR family transcriptional regulator [Gordonia soli]GAC66481.1 putative TetR family transcriptional regulator [Gordonia soli NBRC 108243]
MSVSTSTETSTRARLIDALVVCLGERGFRETTVADIVRVARTSRRAFYQHFEDKQACFVAVLERVHDAMLAAIAAGVDEDADWRSQIGQAVDAYVGSIDAQPAVTLAWIRELPALGQSARPVQLRGMEALITLLVALSDTAAMRKAGISPMSRSTAILIWGGINELTATAVEQGRSVRSIAPAATAACIALVGANIVE